MSSTPDTSPADRLSSTAVWAGYALGFAIGGFFDGILLHQVLQWHHLLSGIETSPFGDLRMQILADGLFHLLMYVIGGVGLVLLFRARRELGLPGAGRLLVASSTIGFGAWHIVDGVLSHWVSGIHRIRMDSEVPLLWDLIWFVAFGLVPLAIGWRMRPHGNRAGGGGHIAASLLALAVLGAAPVAALPPRDVTGAVVLFAPGMSQAAIMAAVSAVGGRVVWVDDSGSLWALDFDDARAARKLHRRGALLVSNSLIPAGCLAWSRPI